MAKGAKKRQELDRKRSVMVIDSNIIIYASYPHNQYLRDFISKNKCAISTISIIETLGYHKITADDVKSINLIIKSSEIIDITRDIVDRAVMIRIAAKISLPDAVIAATALHHNTELVTNNGDDFKNIAGLKIINPVRSI